MLKSRGARVGAFIATMGASAALIGVSVHATGAYFSDTRSGTITGTIGSIEVDTSGGGGQDGLDFNFDNMLPGEPQTAHGSYKNTGANNQDVYIVFYNADALHAINDLGRFGELHITSNNTEIFASRNLNDHPSCPPGASDATHPPCAALPQELKLAENVAPGGTGQFTFTFDYTSRLKADAAEGRPFNCYPLGGCNNAGLPYKIVATQHGVDPYDSNNTTTP